jgi:hypothetical protein
LGEKELHTALKYSESKGKRTTMEVKESPHRPSVSMDGNYPQRNAQETNVISIFLT